MAGKMLACLEHSFQHGKKDSLIKGRDFYDLLWFMQKQVNPLEQKLVKDGRKPYTTRTALLALQEKVASIKKKDLSEDLLPLFESPIFVQLWEDAFHSSFSETMQAYLKIAALGMNGEKMSAFSMLIKTTTHRVEAGISCRSFSQGLHLCSVFSPSNGSLYISSRESTP